MKQLHEETCAKILKCLQTLSIYTVVQRGSNLPFTIAIIPPQGFSSAVQSILTLFALSRFGLHSHFGFFSDTSKLLPLFPAMLGCNSGFFYSITANFERATPRVSFVSCRGFDKKPTTQPAGPYTRTQCTNNNV